MYKSKVKILCWSDAVLASTGFGVVSKHVLKELYKTGKYEIHQLAINYYGNFYDTNEYPYQLSPARLLDPNDPFGNKMLLRALQKEDYDILWILNDTFVVEGIVKPLEKLFEDKRLAGQKTPKIIYYYPVDCTVIPGFTGMIKLADAAVCITEHGKRETLQAIPELAKDIHVIYHGCDTDTFQPLSNAEKQGWRAQHLNIVDPNTFLFINVNRNSVRKDMARTILAFSEFKKDVPNSMLYMHCAARDNQIDLIQACQSLGLNNKTDVVFPANFRLAEGGFPAGALNRFYGSADAFITTTLGEGFGITTVEAMSAGIPVIGPNNTSFPEIIGKDRERGFLYECTERTWIDNSGYRPLGATSDIVNKMHEVYRLKQGNPQALQDIVARASEWTRCHTWEQVCRPWIHLFEDTIKTQKTNSTGPSAPRLQEI